MSNKNIWSSRPLPKQLGRRYSGEMVAAMGRLVADGVLEWRISGTTHFEVRPVKGGEPCILTLGNTSENPVYAAKWRSALRRWGIL